MYVLYYVLYTNICNCKYMFLKKMKVKYINKEAGCC